MQKLPMAIALATLFTGCASQEYVNERIAALEKQLGEIKLSTKTLEEQDRQATGRIDALDRRNAELQGLVAGHHSRIGQLDAAMAQAQSASAGQEHAVASLRSEVQGEAGRIRQLERQVQAAAGTDQAAKEAASLARLAMEQSRIAMERADTASKDVQAIATRLDTLPPAAPAEKTAGTQAPAAQVVGETDQAGRIALIEESVSSHHKRLAEMEGQVGAAIQTARTALDQDKQLELRLKQSESLYSELRHSLVEQQERLARQEVLLQEVSRTAQEALERAKAAGKLARGKLLYEVSFTEDDIHFPFDRYDLSPGCCSVLDAMAAQLKADNRDVYLEIQGHTDSSGPTLYNMNLGMARADAVRRYLHVQSGIPLHRMSVISYGETRPLADNKTREGRKLNRRVIIVVLE